MNSTIQARYNCFYFSQELKISNKLIERKKIEGTQPRDLQNNHMTIMFLHGNLLTKMFQVVTGVHAVCLERLFQVLLSSFERDIRVKLSSSVSTALGCTHTT